MLRTSSYTIYVDLHDNTEEMLLVHGYTGAYDRVSREVARYLRGLEVGGAPRPLYGEWSDEPHLDEPAPAPSESAISALKKRGYLTEKSVEQEEAFFSEMATKLHH